MYLEPSMTVVAAGHPSCDLCNLCALCLISPTPDFELSGIQGLLALWPE